MLLVLSLGVFLMGQPARRSLSLMRSLHRDRCQAWLALSGNSQEGRPFFANGKGRGTIEAAWSGRQIRSQTFFAADHLVRRKPLRLGWHQALITEERNVFVIFWQPLLQDF